MNEDKVNVVADDIEIKTAPDLLSTGTYCDCCGRLVDHVTTLCSGLVAMSFAYCDDCMKKNLEPYNVLVSYFANTKWDDILPYWQNIIKESCRLHCKIVEQFEQDCIDFMENCKHWSENPW